MFGIRRPDYGFGTSLFGGYPQQQRGYPHYRRRQPVYHDPYERYYDDQDYYEDPYSHQLAAKRAALARQQQQQELRRRKQMAKRQEELRKYNDAALVIQRAWRQYKLHQQMEREEEAATIVVRTMKRVVGMLKAQKILYSLRELNKLHHQLNEMVDEFTSNMCGYRNLLFFTDSVEKLILKLDEVQHYRNDFIRARRKAIVRDAQHALRLADLVLKTMRRKAQVVSECLRKWKNVSTEAQQDHAARVITKAVRDFPSIRDAKDTAAGLKSMQLELAEVRKIEKQYREALIRLARQSKKIAKKASKKADASYLKELAVDCKSSCQVRLNAIDTCSFPDHC